MSLITPFDPWKNRLCSCPEKFSLSPYSGCSHGCLYCYAPSYIRQFNQPRAKKDFLKKLKSQITKIPKKSIITIANSSDPYLNLEKKLKLTRQMLEILQSLDLKIHLVTKSSLILRDIDLLKSFKNLTLSISLNTLDEKLSKKLEPNTPSPSQRLSTIKSLSKKIPTLIRFDPLIYPLNTQNIEETIKILASSGARQIITSTYKVKPDNFKKMTEAFPEHKDLWQNLYYAQGQRKSNYIYLTPDLRKNLINRVRDAVLKEGLDFSSCREGFASLNTKPCDGSFYLK